ncbi:hypothetical protein ACPBEH_08290 [Latilactobacillus sp. 5-91]|uniref:hypothetical protein n=1 Tax=Latilactobacillus sp. 5-91 TaxID=3410924 RepID=UPI003C78D89E
MKKQTKQIIGAVLILVLIIIAGFKLGGMIRSQATPDTHHHKIQDNIKKKKVTTTTFSVARKKVVTAKKESTVAHQDLATGSWTTSNYLAVNIESLEDDGQFSIVYPEDGTTQIISSGTIIYKNAGYYELKSNGLIMVDTDTGEQHDAEGISKFDLRINNGQYQIRNLSGQSGSRFGNGDWLTLSSIQKTTKAEVIAGYQKKGQHNTQNRPTDANIVGYLLKMTDFTENVDGFENDIEFHVQTKPNEEMHYILSGNSGNGSPIGGYIVNSNQTISYYWQSPSEALGLRPIDDISFEEINALNWHDVGTRYEYSEAVIKAAQNPKVYTLDE